MALRAVSDLASARFYIPPAMLARILREADPVATVSQQAVRFEAFSACCSSYGRLDLDSDAFTEVTTRSSGTTNVDFGREMKEALARVRPSSSLLLEIGKDALTISHERGSAWEEKSPLPLRWLKGFAEVQQHVASMKHCFSLDRVAAVRLLSQLPRSKDDRQLWISKVDRFARLSASQGPGSVPLKGAHRLAGLAKLAAFATGMDVFHNPQLGSSTWMLKLPAQRLAVTLNGEPWRGFSGDGQLLQFLAAGSVKTDAILRAQLNWQSEIDEESLGSLTGLSLTEVRRGLSRLASVGLLGYDLAHRSWFHRVLPFDLGRIDQLNPRLKQAADLAGAGAVAVAGDGRSGDVKSTGVIHKVTSGENGYHCTCPWFAKHGDTRGPCKHVLAFQITVRETARG
jgi:hypothetical protein